MPARRGLMVLAPAAPIELAADVGPVEALLPRHQRVAPAVFRLSLLGVCLLLAAVTHTGSALPWLAGLLALALLSVRDKDMVSPRLLFAAEVALTCIGVAVTGGATSPLLVYLPAPLLAAGLRHGRGAVAVYGAEAAALLVVGRALSGSDGGSWLASFTATAEWVTISIAVGMLADRIRRFPRIVRADLDASYEEALLLLSQLRSVTRRLPGSLDPVIVAEAVLDSCAGLADFATAAVLVHAGDERLTPLTTRGMRRVPWRHPLTTPGPLQTAWLDATPVLDVRFPDANGRRSGSAVLAIPVRVADRVIGLVVLESPRPDAFAPDLVDRLTDNVLRQALRLGTAVVFDEFQTYASMDERGRLAREMHDGIGQDLAAIGFELDELRHQVSEDAGALAQVARVREHVTDIIRDIRLSITELQSGEILSRGLGAALTSHVRAAGASGGFAVHLSLDESTFRLPADTEAELLRICQELTSAASRTFSATNVWVTLNVDPPAALLRLEHDGVQLQSFPQNADLLQQRVTRVGGRLLVDATSSRARVEITLGGSEDSDPDPGRR